MERKFPTSGHPDLAVPPYDDTPSSAVPPFFVNSRTIAGWTIQANDNGESGIRVYEPGQPRGWLFYPESDSVAWRLLKAILNEGNRQNRYENELYEDILIRFVRLPDNLQETILRKFSIDALADLPRESYGQFSLVLRHYWLEHYEPKLDQPQHWLVRGINKFLNRKGDER